MSMWALKNIQGYYKPPLSRDYDGVLLEHAGKYPDKYVAIVIAEEGAVMHNVYFYPVEVERVDPALRWREVTNE